MPKGTEIAFLCKRLKELREKNNCTMKEMAKKIDEYDGTKSTNKSSISRLESGKTSENTLKRMAEKYCRIFKMSDEQIEQLFRGERIAVPDTSALLKNLQLIDELNKEYSKVIIPKVVVDELDNIKNKNSGPLGRKAWEVIRGISYGDRTILMDYTGDSNEENEDCKIIYIAQKVSDTYHCKIDIITDDTDYSAYLKGNESVAALHLREYMATKQELINISKILKIDLYYAGLYEKCEVPNAEEINAYLPDGNTLIISAVRNRKATFEQKRAKIEWLISHGADINKRDCSRRYFPPISHAVQMGDYDMFLFLLKECKVNPNVGSRNPFDVGKVRQKNEGNMPLMIAAWEGKKDFVIALCEDERTSINQQDANGFTALMKACMNGHFANDRKKRTWNIRKILIDAGADRRIVDIDGKTAADWVNEYHDSGPTRKQFKRGSRNNRSGREQKKGQRRVNRVCISINNRCNLNCRYCHFHEKKDSIKADEMDVVTILDNIMAYIDSNNIDVFKIGFVGNGEPLLEYEALKKYILHISKYLADGRIAAYSITNGLLVDKSKLEFFKEHNVNLGFSIDGVSSIHDMYRCNTHAKVMEKIELYRKVNGKYPSMNCTVGKEILEKTDDTIEFFQRFNTRVTFSRMIGQYGITLDEFNEFLKKVTQKLNVRTGGYDCTMYGGLCGAGRNNFFYANGKIYYCGNCIDLPALGMSSMPIGELEKVSLVFDRTQCYKETICE